MVSKLIYIPLLFLISIACCVQLINLQTPFQGEYNSDVNLDPDEQTTTKIGAMMSTSITVVATAGFVTMFISMIVLGVLISVDWSLLGSTIKMGERGQKLIFNGLFYGGLWGLFSVLATIGINGVGLFSLPLLGIFTYLIMSLFYILGINAQINSGD